MISGSGPVSANNGASSSGGNRGGGGVLIPGGPSGAAGATNSGSRRGPAAPVPVKAPTVGEADLEEKFGRFEIKPPPVHRGATALGRSAAGQHGGGLGGGGPAGVPSLSSTLSEQVRADCFGVSL